MSTADANRRVIANIVMTLDGHTTGPGGEFDMSPIAPHGGSEENRRTFAEMVTATTVLLGRKNYEGFHAYWPAVAEAAETEPRDRILARWLNDVDKIVFSTTRHEVDWQNSRLADDEPAAVVGELRRLPGGDIRVLSSQSIIRQLLAADEIDRLEVTHTPDTTGGGDRLFDETTPALKWTATTVVPTDSGAIRIVYDRAR